MNNRTITTLYIVAGIAFPGTAMFGARYFGQGTSDVKANQESTPLPQMVIVPDVRLIPDHGVGEAGQNKEIESPFWFEVEDYNTLIDPFANMHDPEPIRKEVQMDFVVSTILPSKKNPLAVINSKPCQIGDDIGNGWKLVGIDGKSRTILILHKTGKRITIEMSKN